MNSIKINSRREQIATYIQRSQKLEVARRKLQKRVAGQYEGLVNTR